MSSVPLRCRRSGLLLGVVLATTVASLAVGPQRAAAAAMCGGKAATIVGTAGDDALRGTSASDVVWLGGGDDSFYGYEGDDLICGGAGNDSIYGDDGNDQMWGGAGIDKILPGLGRDRAYGGSGVDYLEYTNLPRDSGGVTIEVGKAIVTGSSGRDQFTGFEAYTGSADGDMLIGSDHGERLDSGPGYTPSRPVFDVIYGRGGDDQIGLGNEGSVHAGPGDDRVGVGVSGRDYEVPPKIKLGPGNDVVDVYSGSQVVWGEKGDDVFWVWGSAFARLYGGPGEDAILLKDRDEGDVIDLREHTGTVRAWSVMEIIGSANAEVFRGDGHPNRISGGGGDDRILGRGGPDHLSGERGEDVVNGGQGEDRCWGETIIACEGGQRL